MNKRIIFLFIIGLYAPYTIASFSAAAAAGAGAGVSKNAEYHACTAPTVQSIANSPLAKLYAKQRSENKLEPWQSIVTKLLPLGLTASKALKHPHQVRHIAWNHNGTQIATDGEHCVFIWNVESGALLSTLNHANFQIVNPPIKNDETYSHFIARPLRAQHAAWHPHNNELASILRGAGKNNKDTYVYIWNAELGKPIAWFPLNEDEINTLSWNRDGTRLMIVTQGYVYQKFDHLPLPEAKESHITVYCWRKKDNQLLRNQCGPESNSLVWNHEGTRVAGRHAKNIFINHPANNLIYTIAHQARILEIKWSHDDSRIATCSEDRTVCVWNLGDGTKIHTLNHQNQKHGAPIEWNHDDTLLVTASFHSEPRFSAQDLFVWDTKKGTLLHTLSHPVMVQAVLWHPDSRHIIAKEYFDLKNTARVWDSQTG